MAVLGNIAAVALKLVMTGMGLHVGIEHGLVDTSVGAIGLRALEGFAALMIPDMILQMMFVLGDKATAIQWTGQQLLHFDVSSLMIVIVVLIRGHKVRTLKIK